jgi:hypothetical protein
MTASGAQFANANRYIQFFRTPRNKPREDLN